MTNHIHDDDEPKPAASAETTSVKTLKYHTLEGEEHQIGDVYEAPAALVGSLLAQGMVAVNE